MTSEIQRAPSSFASRRKAARATARARALGRVRVPIDPDLRAFDPLSRSAAHSGDWLSQVGAALLAAVILHASIGVIGHYLADGDAEGDDRRQLIAIEVREPPPEPAPVPEPEPEPEAVVEETPEPEPEPEPEPKPKPKPKPKRRVDKDPPPPPQDPPPAEPKPPPRVVGLSLDSTSASGAGPAFATGNTTAGATAERAVDPNGVDPNDIGEASPNEPPRPSPNRKATRIPTSGAKLVLPKREKRIEPPYPETLKAQGIEADVTVMVKIDATGAVENVKIIKGSPYPEFDEAARSTALSETFSPATKNGVAIPYNLSFTYRFRLQEQ